MYLGGTNIPNGNPLKLNGAQVTKMMLGAEQIWINTVPPSAILDFAVTNIGIYITATFTPATGIPDPTYDLYESNVMVASGISSGYVYASALPSGIYDYRVDAINVAGTVPSNTVSGNVFVGGSPLIVTANRTIVAGVDVPFGADLNICMVGGAGSGATSDYGGITESNGGGYAGIPVNQTANLADTSIGTITIGAGGVARTGASNQSGAAGVESTFSSTETGLLTATPGSGGITSSSGTSPGFLGNGEAGPVDCQGNVTGFTNGLNGLTGVRQPWGGQASMFGSGGKGNNGGSSGVDGGIGAGGGSYTNNHAGGRSGAGGAGQAVISWESKLIITASGTLTAGIDFPADVDITVCLTGGGGAGVMSSNDMVSNFQGGGGGGGAGAVTTVVNLPIGETVTVTVGRGGIPQTGNGSDGHGTASSFGTYLTGDGGQASYQQALNGSPALGGDGGSGGGRGGDSSWNTWPDAGSPCSGGCGGDHVGGTAPQYWVNPQVYGGAGGGAGGFNDGANGSVTVNTNGLDGLPSAGGSGNGGTSGNRYGGAGGRGEVRLSW